MKAREAQYRSVIFIMKPIDTVRASKEEQTSFQKSKHVFRSEIEATAFEFQTLNPKAHLSLPGIVGLATDVTSPHKPCSAYFRCLA